MTGPLGQVSRDLEAFVDVVADWGSELLRRRGHEMREAADRDFDRHVMAMVEAGTEWRKQQVEKRYASSRS